MVRLGVRQEDVDKSPKISDMLKRVLGSPHKAIDALRFSLEPIAQEFLAVYDAIPSGDREKIPLEAICLKSKIGPSALLGPILMASKQLHAQESALRAIMAHPDVVKNTIQSAKMKGKEGTADRRMLHEAVGFLPSKSGQSINVNLLGGNPKLSGSEDGDEEDDEFKSFDEAFDATGDDLEEWSDNRRKLLSDGK